MPGEAIPVIEDDVPSIDDQARAVRENADLGSVRDIVNISLRKV